MSKYRAFTLVELLVVISIIALLLSILMPSLSKAREQARSVVCKTGLKNLGLAAITYGADNDDIFIAQDWSVFDPAVGKNLESDYWFYRLAPYIGNSGNRGEMGNIGRCPSGLARKEYEQASFTDFKSIDIALHWYGREWHYYNVKGVYGKISQIERPAEFASFFDFYYGSERYGSSPGGIGSVYGSRYGTVVIHVLYDIKVKEVFYRHNDGINAVYLDGHVGQVKRNTDADLAEWERWQREWPLLTLKSLDCPREDLQPPGHP